VPDPEFQSLLSAAIWWRDYAMKLSGNRTVSEALPESPYPALYSYTPYPPPGVVPEHVVEESESRGPGIEGEGQDVRSLA
jgi:hypothetical protein